MVRYHNKCLAKLPEGYKDQAETITLQPSATSYRGIRRGLNGLERSMAKVSDEKEG